MKDLSFTLMGSGQHDWQGVYAHNQAEAVLDRLNKSRGLNWVAPDLISANYPPEMIGEGIHPCTLVDEPATLYLWKADYRWRGYVILPEDKEAVQLAEKRFKIKPWFL